MIGWTAERVAQAAGARLLHAGRGRDGPRHAVISSADAGPGALFAGLPGANVDGGRFAGQALKAGAWGVLVRSEHAEPLAAAAPAGAVLAADDPLRALQRLAAAWRRELGAAGATVIGVTGSTGKTTTKELVAAMGRSVVPTHATPKNLNTEIGLPLTVLAAPAGTRLLVLEMAMRGAGQIAELARIAEAEIGIVVNVGPAHLEQLGSIEAIAAEKASLLDHLPPGGTAIVPAGEPLLARHRRDGIRWVTFGETEGDSTVAALPPALGLAERPAHVRLDAAAALAAVRAAGLEPQGPVTDLPADGRGAVRSGIGGSTIVDDCYNANPMSMRAALADLARAPGSRRVAVLGDMLELGPRERELHAELADHASEASVDLLVTVGPRAAAAAERFDGPTQRFDDAAAAAAALPVQIAAGDVVLVKGSRGVGLEVVVGALTSPTTNEDS